MIKRIYKLLEIPWFYRFVGKLLGPGGATLSKPVYQKVFNRSAERVLDIGCGPKLNTLEPSGLLVGVDINESYLRQYTGGFLDQDTQLVLNPPASRRRLGFLASGDHLPFNDGIFDEVRTSSFFHHLSDKEAAQALKEMNRCLRMGGRMVIFEDVFPFHAWVRPLAWLIRRMDRGRHMRYQEALLKLCQESCPGSWEWFRFTYTYTGMEYLCLQYFKK